MRSGTIVSLITAPLTSAVAVIRISGDEAFLIAEKIFSKPLPEPNGVKFGEIKRGEETVDQVVLTCFKGPRSFTGEDIVEISCHGSMLIVQEILELIQSFGSRLAERGEFSARAFYNGKIDLVQAESIQSAVEASTAEAKKLALYSMEGKTSNLVRPMVEELADLLSNIEVNIDYPEYRDIGEITLDQADRKTVSMIENIDDLLGKSRKSRYIVNGIRVALVGLPNTGKSSLLNAFLQKEKAIVTDIPGTTRDIVEGSISLNGLPLHLMDTAGIRNADNLVEQIGIARSKESIEEADLVLLILDAAREMTEEENHLIEELKERKHLIVYNKADLVKVRKEGRIYISALKNEIGELKEAILSLFDLTPKDVVPSLCNSRQIGLLENAKIQLVQAHEDAKNLVPLDLVGVSIKGAYDSLREILGETVNVDLEQEIFSRFCVGK